MKILGIDIGNGEITCCLLDHLPTSPRDLSMDGANFISCKADASGIKTILKINPDIAVLEPTGVNYSKIWTQYLAENGIEFRLVGHSSLAAHRSVCDLPNKDDESDSLTLAHYGWFYKDDPSRFLRIRDEKISALRRDSLRLQHLKRVQNPITNRMRQDLAWQFPEISKRQIKLQGKTPPIILRWLSGEASSKRYDKLYAKTIGLGLTDEVRNHAARLCDCFREQIAIETRCFHLAEHQDYDYLNKVFIAFGFGDRTRAILISQIHPFSDYLGDDDKPIINISRGKYSHKPTKKHRSRRRFEKALGCAPTRAQSGTSDTRKVIGGSSLCRRLLWFWVFGQAGVAKIRIKNPVLEAVWLWQQHPKRRAKPSKLLKMNTCSHLARLLFKALIASQNGKTPRILNPFEGKDRLCNGCGELWVGKSCPKCDKLNQKLDNWFESFLK